jgi:hypothetical protein
LSTRRVDIGATTLKTPNDPCKGAGTPWMLSMNPVFLALVRGKTREWAAAVALTACAIGCGGGRAVAPEASAPSAAPAIAQGASPSGTSGPPTAPPSVPDARPGALLIYTAALSMAVFQVDASLAAVERIGREEGGYLAARQDRSVTIRVPRERFDDAIERVEHLGDVTHRSVKAQDVTDEFVDLEARLKNARAMRDRLNELLARASVKEALDIERELARVTEEIERFEGRLKLLRDQIAFSTITVDFAPVANQVVHDTSLITSIPWLRDLGLPVLLGGHR